MNYYNPYFFSMPTSVSTPKIGLFSRLFGGLNLSKILNGTQKVLNFANQTIPLVQQVRPLIGNAKTMFKVMNEFKKTEKTNTNINQNKVSSNTTTENITTRKSNNLNNNIDNNLDNIGPTFFV